MSTVCSGVTPWGGASNRRLPGSIPAGYVSQTGYQYEAISRVAGHRELAPPSKFLKLGGFNRSVFITEATETSSTWNWYRKKRFIVLELALEHTLSQRERSQNDN